MEVVWLTSNQYISIYITIVISLTVAEVSNSLSIIQPTEFWWASYLELIIFIQTLHDFQEHKYKLASDLFCFFVHKLM